MIMLIILSTRVGDNSGRVFFEFPRCMSLARYSIRYFVIRYKNIGILDIISTGLYGGQKVESSKPSFCLVLNTISNNKKIKLWKNWKIQGLGPSFCYQKGIS